MFNEDWIDKNLLVVNGYVLIQDNEDYKIYVEKGRLLNVFEGCVLTKDKMIEQDMEKSYLDFIDYLFSEVILN